MLVRNHSFCLPSLSDLGTRLYIVYIKTYINYTSIIQTSFVTNFYARTDFIHLYATPCTPLHSLPPPALAGVFQINLNNGRERTFRHTNVCKMLAKLIRKTSSNSRVTLEPRDASSRHPDIAVVMTQANITSTSPSWSLPQNMRSQDSIPQRPSKAWLLPSWSAPRPRNTRRVPFVLESTGYLGKCAEVLLEKVTRDSPHLLKWFKGELSLILARMRMHSQSMLVV